MQFHAELIWFLAGLALAFLEFMAPGVILVFFAAGAWIVAITTWMGLTTSLPWQMIVFAVSSIGLLILLRRQVRGKFLGHSSAAQDPDMDLDDFVGKTATVTEAITPARPGSVEFKGAAWSARSTSSLAVGDQAVIDAVESLTLIVRPISSSPSTEEEANS